MTNAAIYARKSTDDSDRDPANKSVTRQVEHGRAYAASKGWTVEEAHVYVDDGVSGAEFENRPGFTRLIADLPKRGKAPFDVLIMSEVSRFGRDQQRTGYYLAKLYDAGVRIFYYLEDAEEKLDTPVQRFMLAAKSFMAEEERMKAGQRSRDALQRKASKGYNSGGVVYGYDNVPVYNGEVRSHTDYRINEAEADVLRRAFRMYADGYGVATIAKTLNGEPRLVNLSKRYFNGARPASPRKGTGSWAPSSVRAMLCNERYTGVVAFGEHRKVYRHGTKVRIRQPETVVQRAKREDLRIIPEALWAEVRSRFDAARKTYLKDTGGKVWGRPGMAVESKYLLSGLGECGCCGHNITMLGGRSGRPGNRKAIFYYGCGYNHNRGSTVCSNEYHARMDDADSVVLDKVRGVLTPEAVDYTIDRAIQLANERRSGAKDATERLDAEGRRLRKELDRLVRAITGGAAPASLVAEIQRREARLAELDRERSELEAEEPSEIEERGLRRAFLEQLGQFDTLLRSDVPLARQALRKLLAGRIRFEPTQHQGAPAYRLRWSLTTTALMGGYIRLASHGKANTFFRSVNTLDFLCIPGRSCPQKCPHTQRSMGLKHSLRMLCG